MFKTKRVLYSALEALLLELHPYQVPAVFAVPIAGASSEYASWIATSLTHTHAS